MSNNVVQNLQTGAYGELLVCEHTAVGQFDATYGLVDSIMVDTTNGSGTVTSANAKFSCSTGTDSDGLAALTTRRYINYKPGQGLSCEISALFPSSGAANSVQVAGLITSENTVGFGYVGTEFGIMRLTGGSPEYQELTLTVAAAGAETATVTIDGTGYPVSLTGAGTLIVDAYEIASALNGTVPNYIITSNNDQVLAQAIIPGAAGSFAYSSTGTSTGSWTQVQAGVALTPSFTAKADWNEDTKPDLDVTKGNIYKIQKEYLGFGNIKFFVEDKETGEYILVHQEKYANTNTIPSSSASSFRAGWAVQNTGNTTDLTIEGASTGQFIEGKSRLVGPLFSSDNTQASVGTTLTNVLAIRNRSHFGNNINRVELYPRLISASTDTTKSAVFKLVLNPTFGANMDFQYLDKDNSVVEESTTSASVSGGKVVGSIRFRSSAAPQIRFNDSDRSDFTLAAGQTLSIAAQVSSGAASEMDASISWQEDL